MKLKPEEKRASLELLEVAFQKCSGLANVRVCGEQVGYDRDRMELFIDRYGKETIWMPAGSFLAIVTDDEAATMRDLPVWDGSNGYQISLACIAIVGNAICRYRGRT